jgi:hypothetical protein
MHIPVDERPRLVKFARLDIASKTALIDELSFLTNTQSSVAPTGRLSRRVPCVALPAMGDVTNRPRKGLPNQDGGM